MEMGSSFFLALLLSFLALGLEIQGRKRLGMSYSTFGRIFAVLYTKKGDPQVKARLFCLLISVLFGLWEGTLWVLFSSDGAPFTILRVLGLILLLVFIGRRYRVYFWEKPSEKEAFISQHSVLLFYGGYCLLIFAPLSALLLGLWIGWRWRQKFGVSQIGQNKSYGG